MFARLGLSQTPAHWTLDGLVGGGSESGIALACELMLGHIPWLTASAIDHLGAAE
jgi:hypothetical protein